MGERRAGVGLGGERRGGAEIQANDAAFALNVGTTRCVYRLLLQLLVLPADQNRRFLENWGEKTQRLSSACWRPPGGGGGAGRSKANVLDADMKPRRKKLAA